jgi:hypothetical protein
MKLITNDMTVSQQFQVRYRIDHLCENWYRHVNDVSNWYGIVWSKPMLALLEEHAGMRCSSVNNDQQLTGYELVDEKKYSWFVLQYSYD